MYLSVSTYSVKINTLSPFHDFPVRRLVEIHWTKASILLSPYAFARTWYRHTAGLRSDSGTLQLAEQAKKDAEVDVEDDTVRDSREQEAARTAGAWLRQHKAALGTSISQIDATLLAMNLAPDTVYAEHPFENGAPGDSKIDALVQWISTNLRTGKSWNGEGVDLHRIR